MLITRESDYALRVLRALRDGKQHSAGEIARQEQVPQQFAYKIVKKLSKAGLVSIARGAGGGYRLSADLSKVTLYDLISATEENVCVTACMDPDYVCPWREVHCGCHIHGALSNVQRRLDNELRSYTLEHILGPAESS